MSEMICPVMTRPVTYGNTNISRKVVLVACKGKRCAWWVYDQTMDGQIGQCAILEIAQRM